MALAQFSVTVVSFDSGAGKLSVAFLLQQRSSNPSLLYRWQGMNRGYRFTGALILCNSSHTNMEPLVSPNMARPRTKCTHSHCPSCYGLSSLRLFYISVNKPN